MKQKSEKERLWWAQFNALEMGSGWDESDIAKPQIMIEDVYGDSHPGSVHLHQLATQAGHGVYEKADFLHIIIQRMSVTDVHRGMME